MTSIHLTVATVIKQDDRFLAVRETSLNRPHAHVINQPAGHVEFGETLQEAAIRETLEETGWVCEIEHAIGIYHYISDASNSQYLRICFAGKLVQQKYPSPPDPTILSTEWLTLQDVEAIHNQATMPHTTTAHAKTTHSSLNDGSHTKANPQRWAPKVLRSPIVLTCFRDYDRGAVMPWQCLQEQPLVSDRQNLADDTPAPLHRISPAS